MILFFMRGWPKWTPPTLASVSMIEAKTIQEMSRNFLLLLKINIIYSPRNKPGTLTPGKQLKDGDKGSIISIS